MNTQQTAAPAKRTPRPVPEITADQFLHDALRTAMDSLLRYARAQSKGAILQKNPERIHDYRVAIRVLRTQVSAFKSVFPAAERKAMESRLRTLSRQTGTLRDLDVLLDARRALDARIPSRWRAPLDTLFGPFEARRNEERRRILSQFKSRAHRESLDALEELIGRRHPDSTVLTASVRPALAPVLQRRKRKVAKLARKFQKNPSIANLHALRIAGKKLRYLVESFQRVLPASAVRSVLRELKQAQDVLGKAHDLSFQRMAVLNALSDLSANAPEDPDTTKAASRLATALRRDENATRREALAACRTLLGPSLGSRFDKILRCCSKSPDKHPSAKGGQPGG